MTELNFLTIKGHTLIKAAQAGGTIRPALSEGLTPASSI